MLSCIGKRCEGNHRGRASAPRFRPALKKAVRHRKNLLFYKTETVAEVGDLVMSLIHVCELNNTNPFDYPTELQNHNEELAKNPAA